MPNDYLNPFSANNISSTTSTTSTTSVGTVDNSNASIMANNSSSTMNYALSPSDLKEDDIELIKKELERKIQEQKDDLENAKNTRGWATSAWNWTKGLFGGGDKKAQNNISNYEALLSGLDSDISNIDEVYKTIMGSDLDLASLQSLKGSEALASSIDLQTQEAIVAELENQLAALESNFETAQNSNGWISGTWNAFKNWTGVGASSNKTSAEINDLKEQIAKLKNGEADLATTFKNITGTDLNAENLTSLLSGEAGTGLNSISNAGQSVNAYSEGQKMCSDVVGDMVSGIVAVGAVAAAPFTGGASLLLAAGVGAGIKVAIKASDCIGNEKTYGLKDLGYDLVTGSINGAMAPISNGLGGAAGTGVAKMFGLKALQTTAKEGLEQAAKVAGKEVLEEVVEETGEAILKTVTKEVLEEGTEQASKGIISRILAKQGTEYVLKEGAEATAKTTIGKIASYAADMAVDGAFSGATDGFARAAAEGRWEDIPQEMLQGGLGGLIASPIIGGGFRVATKAGSTVINKINNKITIGSLLPDGTMTKFSQGEIGDCALLSMLDGFLGNSKTAKQIQNAITTSSDGGYNVKIGSQTVKIAREELTDEMLSDTTGIRVFELAYQKAGGSLDGEFAENVAKTFGLNPVHINSDGITDEVLETISKDSDNLILSLGARVDADGTITPDGEFQHYFSIKNVDPETRTLTLVDTYDTSKTFEMSFDDIKTQGVSIDGGNVKKTDLPSAERSADEVGFRGSSIQEANNARILSPELQQKRNDAFIEYFSGLNSEEDIKDIVNYISKKFSSNPLYNTEEKLIQNFPWELSPAFPHISNYMDTIKYMHIIEKYADTSIDYDYIAQLYNDGIFSKRNWSCDDPIGIFETLISGYSEEIKNIPFKEIKNNENLSEILNNQYTLKQLLNAEHIDIAKLENIYLQGISDYNKLFAINNLETETQIQNAIKIVQSGAWFIEDASGNSNQALLKLAKVEDAQQFERILEILKKEMTFADETASTPYTSDMLIELTSAENYQNADLKTNLQTLLKMPGIDFGEVSLIDIARDSEFCAQFKALTQNRGVAGNFEEIKLLADLVKDPANLEKFDTLNKSGLFMADTLVAIMNDDELYKRALNYQERGVNLALYGSLIIDNDINDRLQRILTFGVDVNENHRVSGVIQNETLYNQVITLLEQGKLTKEEIFALLGSYSATPEKEFNRMIELLDEMYFPKLSMWDLRKFTSKKIDDETFGKIKTIAQSGLFDTDEIEYQTSNLLDIAKNSSTEEINKISKLIQAGGLEKLEEIQSVAKNIKTDKELDRACLLIKNGINQRSKGSISISSLEAYAESGTMPNGNHNDLFTKLDLPDDEFNNLLVLIKSIQKGKSKNLFDWNFDARHIQEWTDSLVNFASSDDKLTFEWAKTMFAEGFDLADVNKTLGNEQCFKRAIELSAKPNMKRNWIIYFAQNANPEEYSYISELANYLNSDQILYFYNKGKLAEICNSQIYSANKNTILKVNNNKTLSNEAKSILTDRLLGVYDNDYSKLTLREKMNQINVLKEAQSCDIFTDEERNFLNIDNEIIELQDSIKKVIATTSISKEATHQMMSGFFANNNPQLDNLLSTTDFGQFGKSGLPLEYPRQTFISDLSETIKDLPESQQADILKKLGITLANNEGVIGYNGIIDLTKLSQEGVEGDVLSLATKFIKENSISTGDSELDEALNSLIQGMPEFINVIGKQQHGTQDFSVDIHMLTVLKEAMSNPNYQNLSNQDKFCLKFVTILHDIAKSEGVVDDGHAELCALYARDILNKDTISLSVEMKDRIYELVKNHHWLADYNTGKIKSDEVAALYRRTGDLEIAQIMAEADLKGVKADGSFYDSYGKALNDDMQIPVQNALTNINSQGQMFLTNKIIDSSKIPTVLHNGTEYQIINFAQLAKSTDLQQYGFEPGTTVDNLRLMIHTVDKRHIKDLENTYTLKDPSYQGYLCASYVSVENHPTYFNNKFGVSLESEQVNIANAAKSNQGSGCGKDFSRFSNTITGTDETSKHRYLVPSGVKKALGLTDDEYAELFAQVQKYKYVSQLDNVQEIKIGNKTFTGTQVKAAILEADDLIMKNENSVWYSKHNEANLYSPKVNAVIAKVDSLDKVPQELLDFAQTHNLPIYLLGE